MNPHPALEPVPRHVVALGLLAFAACTWAFIEAVLVVISDLSVPLV